MEEGPLAVGLTDSKAVGFEYKSCSTVSLVRPRNIRVRGEQFKIGPSKKGALMF